MSDRPNHPAARISIASDHEGAPIRVEAFEGQVTPRFRVPLSIIIDGERVLCQSAQLPLQTGSLGHINLENALEFAIDDARLLREAHRVLVAGGVISLEVPNSTVIAAFDAFNAFRYLKDVTGFGPSLPEIAETGWRRHYARPELESMLREAGFEIDSWGTRGLGGGELGVAYRLVRRWIGSRSRAIPVFGHGEPSAKPGKSSAFPGSGGARLRFLAHKPLEQASGGG